MKWYKTAYKKGYNNHLYFRRLVKDAFGNETIVWYATSINSPELLIEAPLNLSKILEESFQNNNLEKIDLPQDL